MSKKCIKQQIYANPKIIEYLGQNRLQKGWTSIMDEYTACEQAYKNGYEKGSAQGKKDAIIKGEWIFGETQGHSWMKCSACLKSQSGQTATFNFCSNCGAIMEGETK